MYIYTNIYIYLIENNLSRKINYNLLKKNYYSVTYSLNKLRKIQFLQLIIETKINQVFT